MSNAIKSQRRPRARQWNRSEAADALRDCGRSGLTFEACAKREGYSGQRLRNSQRRLCGQLTTAPVNFVPVKITGAAAMPRENAQRDVSIDVGSVTVRVAQSRSLLGPMTQPHTSARMATPCHGLARIAR